MVNAQPRPVPSILEVAALAAERPGIDPPTPRWSAVLAYLYGLPLSDSDVAELASATKRSPEAIIAHAQHTMGRRRFRQLWARIGRRARKSATAALTAVYEAKFGGHEAHILPGEQALAAVISKDIAGANVVTRFAKVYLDALGLKYSTTRIGAVSLIEIEDCQIAIATLAATSEAPRGFAICVLILDEFAHTPTGDEYQDTDRSLLSGAEPAMAQFPDALVIGISTGFGRDGVHYERVERGLGNDNEHEILAVTGASWEWSSDITEARAIEIADGNADVLEAEFRGGLYENEALWMPQADVLPWFEPREEYYLWHPPVDVIDMAESGDELAFGRFQWGDPDPTPRHKPLLAPRSYGLTGDSQIIGTARDAHGMPIALPIATRPVLRVTNVGGYDGKQVRQLGMNRVIDELGEQALAGGSRQIIGDDRAGPQTEALFSRFRSRGLTFSWVHYANLKHDAVLLCRQWSRDRMIWVDPADPELRKQALRYRRTIRGNGFSYGKPGVRDDRVCLFITLAVALLRRNEEASHSTPRIEGAPTQLFRGGRTIGAAR